MKCTRKKFGPNNIIYSKADQTEALDIPNSTIPLVCHSAHRGYAGSGRQLHPLKAKDWMSDKRTRPDTLPSISRGGWAGAV